VGGERVIEYECSGCSSVWEGTEEHSDENCPRCGDEVYKIE